jgi:hypothetical protein
MVTILRQMNADRDLVRTGWSMFYIFTQPELALSCARFALACVSWIL